MAEGEGIQESGVRLVVQQFREYMQRLRAVAKGHREAFKRPPEMEQLRKEQEQVAKSARVLGEEWAHTATEAKKMHEAYKKTAADAKDTTKEMGRFDTALGNLRKEGLPGVGRGLWSVGEVIITLNKLVSHLVGGLARLVFGIKQTDDRARNLGRGLQETGYAVGNTMRLSVVLKDAWARLKGVFDKGKKSTKEAADEQKKFAGATGFAARAAIAAAIPTGKIGTLLKVLSPRAALAAAALKLIAKILGVSAKAALGAVAPILAVGAAIVLLSKVAKKLVQVALKSMKKALKKAADVINKVFGPSVKWMREELKKLVEEAGPYAARVETLGIALKQVGLNAGYTAKQLDWATKQVERSGITTKAARQILIRFVQTELDLAKATTLARKAQEVAVVANRNSSETAEIFAEALATGNIVRLKTLGLVVRFTEAEERLATQLGKKRKELSQSERTLARYNEIVAQAGKFSGVYAEAQKTVAKQEKSLARFREQTMLNIGSLTKITMRIQVESQTAFYKAVTEATYGLRTLGEVVNHLYTVFKELLLPALINIGKAFLFLKPAAEDAETLFYKLGRHVHKFSQFLVQSFVAIGHYAVKMALLPKALEKVVTGQMNLAEAIEYVDKKAQAFSEAQIRHYQKEMPSAFMSYKELIEGVETDLNRASAAAETFGTTSKEALEDQKDAAEALVQAISKVEDVYVNYMRSVEDLERDHAKRVADLAEKQTKERIKAEQKLYARMAKVTQDAKERERKILLDSNERLRKLELDYQRKREQARRSFQLKQIQSLRRFKQEESWLAAEGDILGLMRLRQQYDLEQKEAKENEKLKQREAKDEHNVRLREQQEQTVKQLTELRRSIQQQRVEILAAYRKEIDELRTAHAEQTQELQESYDERRADLRRNLDRQLEDMTRHWKNEGKITAAGLVEIMNLIRGAFDEEGVATVVLHAWAQRSKNIFADVMESIKVDIEQLETYLKLVEEGQVVPSAVRRIPRPPSGRKHRMQSGGSGVVTGPATFEVEAGRTEAYSFTPLPMSSTLNVQMSGGFDVRGADRASAGIVDASLEQMVHSLEVALQTLRVRRGR